MKNPYPILSRIIMVILFSALYQTLSAQAWVWVKSYGGTDKDKGHDLGADALGNQYISGFFTNEMTLGSITLEATGDTSDEDIFVAKLDVDGTPVWAHSMGNGFFNNGDFPSGMSVNAAGWSATTGKCYKYLKLDNGDSIPAFGNDDMFLVSYDPDGNLNWAKVGGGSGTDHGAATYVDNSQNIYCTGTFDGAINFFGDSILNYPFGRHIYCAKYDVGGNLLWIKIFDSATGAEMRTLSVDGSGNIYMGGDFNQEINFDAFPLVANGGYDGFLVKMDQAGNVLWANSFGASNDSSFESCAALALDASGNCYVASTFAGDCNYDGINPLVTNDNTNIMVAAYGPGGNLMWATPFKGGPDARFSNNTLKLVAEESIVLVGSFAGIDTVGSTILQPYGTNPLERDGFIVSLSPAGFVNWAIHMGGSDHDAAYALAGNNSAFCYAAGNYRFNAQFGSINLVSNGESDMWIAKFEKNTVTGNASVPGNPIFQAFPNPFNDELVVGLPLNTTQLTIYNMWGQVVIQKNISKTEKQISLDFYAPAVGMYTIQLKGDYGVTTGKIEKQSY